MATCDVLVIGGGIVGLWTAKRAADAGLQVMLVDREKCGSGGSGGMLGALLAHLPNAMNVKNRFQFEALAGLSDLIKELEETTGISTGYARCGRLMPIRHQGFQKTAELCRSKSAENWKYGNRQYLFDIVPAEVCPDWLDPESAPLGVARDDLAAKVTPRDYIAALRNSVAARGTVIEGFDVVDIDRKSGAVTSADGRTVTAGRIVIAAGYRSYQLLEKLTGSAFGAGVKGHAALFCITSRAQQPVLFDDGMYIVHHAPDRCAVGSTTEPEWQGEHETEEGRATVFIEKAKKLCPALQEAECLGLWAGVRPRSQAKDPMIGSLWPDGRILVATGGFKISFGIAHRIAEYITGELNNSPERIDLPTSYHISHHIRCGIEMGRLGDEWREQVIR